MIKKISFIFLICCLLASCGKKGDPTYEDPNKKVEKKLTSEVLKVFNLKNSVNSKKSYGGTSFDNIKKMIMKYKKQK